MDMRFHWLHNQECQQQFCIYWHPGKLNYADYWTKYHPETHHRNMQKEFLPPHIVLKMLWMEQQIHAACGEMAKLFCMQFILHADLLFLQRSAVLYPAENFRENGRHFPFNN